MDLREQVAELTVLLERVQEAEQRLAEVRDLASAKMGEIYQEHGGGPFKKGGLTFRIIVSKDKNSKNTYYRLRRPAQAVEV
jgi:hypothetical protein